MPSYVHPTHFKAPTALPERKRRQPKEPLVWNGQARAEQGYREQMALEERQRSEREGNLTGMFDDLDELDKAPASSRKRNGKAGGKRRTMADDDDVEVIELDRPGPSSRQITTAPSTGFFRSSSTPWSPSRPGGTRDLPIELEDHDEYDRDRRQDAERARALEIFPELAEEIGSSNALAGPSKPRVRKRAPRVDRLTLTTGPTHLTSSAPIPSPTPSDGLKPITATTRKLNIKTRLNGGAKNLSEEQIAAVRLARKEYKLAKRADKRVRKAITAVEKLRFEKADERDRVDGLGQQMMEEEGRAPHRGGVANDTLGENGGEVNGNASGGVNGTVNGDAGGSAFFNNDDFIAIGSSTVQNVNDPNVRLSKKERRAANKSKENQGQAVVLENGAVIGDDGEITKVPKVRKPWQRKTRGGKKKRVKGGGIDGAISKTVTGSNAIAGPGPSSRVASRWGLSIRADRGTARIDLDQEIAAAEGMDLDDDGHLAIFTDTEEEYVSARDGEEDGEAGEHDVQMDKGKGRKRKRTIADDGESDQDSSIANGRGIDTEQDRSPAPIPGQPSERELSPYLTPSGDLKPGADFSKLTEEEITALAAKAVHRAELKWAKRMRKAERKRLVLEGPDAPGCWYGEPEASLSLHSATSEAGPSSAPAVSSFGPGFPILGYPIQVPYTYTLPPNKIRKIAPGSSASGANKKDGNARKGKGKQTADTSPNEVPFDAFQVKHTRWEVRPISAPMDDEGRTGGAHISGRNIDSDLGAGTSAQTAAYVTAAGTSTIEEASWYERLKARRRMDSDGDASGARDRYTASAQNQAIDSMEIDEMLSPGSRSSESVDQRLTQKTHDQPQLQEESDDMDLANDFQPFSTHGALTHPFRMLSPATRFDLPFLSDSYAQLRTVPKHMRPSDTYLEHAAGPPCQYIGYEEANYPGRKLLVTDLNGALLVRSDFDERRNARFIYNRPYLPCLMSYLFPSRADTEDPDPWQTFVWSSARPNNVAAMVEASYGQHASSVAEHAESREDSLRQWMDKDADERPSRVLGVWSRDHMGLSQADYNRKVQTSKDLARIVYHFQQLDLHPEPASPLHQPYPHFFVDLDNILLLDDSVDKATMQPFNHLPIPDYTNDIRRQSMHVFSQMRSIADTTRRSFNGTAQDRRHAVLERVELLQFMFGEASGFYEACVLDRRVFEPYMDIALLGVIGILSEVEDVASLPTWMAAGGLLPDVRHTFTAETAARGWTRLVENDLAILDEQDDAEETPDPVLIEIASKHRPQEAFPISESYLHWFQDPLVLLYWIRRGLVEVERLKIPLNPGVSVQAWQNEQRMKAEQQSMAYSSVQARGPMAMAGSSHHRM